MSVTTINRTEQIRAGSTNTWVTNDASGLLHDTSVTASRAVATDSNGLPVASATTSAQLAYLQGLTSLTVGDVINVSSGGNLQDSGILSSNLFLADGSVSATGAFNLNSHQIHNVTDPTSAQDAATKNYVDMVVNGLTWKSPVAAATVTVLPNSPTYSNGSSGVGATLTAGSNGALIIDGYTVLLNDRVLVQNQASAFQNGIYTQTTLGDGSHAYVLTRATDSNTPSELQAGTATFATNGTSNGDHGFLQTTTGTITIGTTNLVYITFTSAVSAYFAGSGLTLTGSTFSVNTDGTTTQITSNNVAVITGNLTDAGTDGITITGGTGVLVGSSGASISQHVADATHNGYLSSTDWNTFNGKLSTSLTSAHIFVGNGSNIATDTAMTGDVSITNTGVTSISSGLATHFVTRETPSGSINGSNTTFTLANTPVSGTECVYLNGVLQESGAGNDYTISGATITYLAAPQTGDRLLVNYQK